HGTVLAWNPRSRELERRAAGACDANGTDFDCGAGQGAIVYATLLAPDGKLYELWARRDGEPPALLQLDDDRWYVVVAAVDGTRFAIAADRAGHVYAYSGTRVLALRR